MSWNVKQWGDLPGQEMDERDFRRGNGRSKGPEASECVSLRAQLLSSVSVAQLHPQAAWVLMGAENSCQNI